MNHHIQRVALLEVMADNLYLPDKTNFSLACYTCVNNQTNMYWLFGVYTCKVNMYYIFNFRIGKYGEHTKQNVNMSILCILIFNVISYLIVRTSIVKINQYMFPLDTLSK